MPLDRPLLISWQTRGLLRCLLVCLCFTSAACYALESPLFRIQVDGTGLQRFTPEQGRICGSPDWSPDGKWVAYDTWLSGEPLTASQICVASADGKQSRIIGAGAMPSWSPDGKQIVCHTYDSPQTIVVMNADGSGRETILNHWGSPRWSPRHHRIASLGSRRQLLLFDLQTGKERVLLADRYSLELGFSISPDGSRFCFGDLEGGVAIATLHEKSLETEVKWLVKHGKTAHTSWSPDSKRVVFQWYRPGDATLQLYIQDINSPDPPQRLPGQDPLRHNANPDWSPDGKTILFNSFPPEEPSR